MTHIYEEIFFWLPVLVVTLFWAVIVALACRQTKSGMGEPWQSSAQELPPLFCIHEEFYGPEEPLTPDQLRQLLGKPSDDDAVDTAQRTHFTQEGGFSTN